MCLHAPVSHWFLCQVDLEEYAETMLDVNNMLDGASKKTCFLVFCTVQYESLWYTNWGDNRPWCPDKIAPLQCKSMEPLSLCSGMTASLDDSVKGWKVKEGWQWIITWKKDFAGCLRFQSLLRASIGFIHSGVLFKLEKKKINGRGYLPVRTELFMSQF